MSPGASTIALQSFVILLSSQSPVRSPEEDLGSAIQVLSQAEVLSLSTGDQRRSPREGRRSQFRNSRRPSCLKMKNFHHRGPACNPSTFRYCRPRRNILPDPTHCPMNVLSTTRPPRDRRTRSTTSRRSTASPTSSAQCQVAPGPRRKTAHERRSARLHPINEQPDGTSVEDQCQPDRRFLPRLARLASGTHIKFLNMPITTQSSIRNGAQVSSSPPHVR